VAPRLIPSRLAFYLHLDLGLYHVLWHYHWQLLQRVQLLAEPPAPAQLRERLRLQVSMRNYAQTEILHTDCRDSTLYSATYYKAGSETNLEINSNKTIRGIGSNAGFKGIGLRINGK
jgi:hypothetical protein